MPEAQATFEFDLERRILRLELREQELIKRVSHLDVTIASQRRDIDEILERLTVLDGAAG